MVPAQRARRIYLTVMHVTKIPLWKPSPDSEEIRQHLLTMLDSMLDDIGEDWWRPKPDLEQAAIIQLGKFGERRAVQGLVRNLKHGFNWLSRTRAGTIMEGECTSCCWMPSADCCSSRSRAVRCCSTAGSGSGSSAASAPAQQGPVRPGAARHARHRRPGERPVRTRRRQSALYLRLRRGVPRLPVQGGDPGRGGGADAGVRAGWGLSTSSMPSWSTRDRAFTNRSGEAPSSTVTANS